MDDYVPRSPDLSALETSTPNDAALTSNPFGSPFDTNPNHNYDPPPLYQTPTDSNQHTRESFSLPAGAASNIASQIYSPPPPRPPAQQLQYGDPYANASYNSSFYNHPPPQPHQPYNQDPQNLTPASSMATTAERPRGRPRRNVKKPAPTYNDVDSPTDAEFLPSPTSPPPTTAPQSLPLDHDPTAALRPITIKTKFPLARIKRIVQADEDVGKVAQATPVAVSRALEQFMIQLAGVSADVAKARGSRRVTAADMKSAVGRDEVFDFLEGVVGRIADAPAGKAGKGGKVESSPDIESGGAEEVEVVPKGKKRTRAPGGAAGGGRRRKKAADGGD